MPSAPGYGVLRRNRVSIIGARYFVTLNTVVRASGLNEPPLCFEIRKEFAALEADNVLKLHASVIMPDHLHVLFSLMSSRTVGQIVGRLKSKTKLGLVQRGLSWQGNFYERRLRVDDRLEDVVRYIFLNPYRTGLVAPGGLYSHFWLGSEESSWFQRTLDESRPFPDWLR